MKAEFDSKFEALRASWYDTDEATFYANEGQYLLGAADIVVATEADRSKKAKAGQGPMTMRIDKDTDDEINETFIEHEYSESDVEPHEKDIEEQKKEAAAKVFARVRTTLSKPYNAGDTTLRVPDKCGAKKGIKMKITDNNRMCRF